MTYLRKYATLIVATLITVIGGYVLTSQSASRDDELAHQEATISNLQNQIDVKTIALQNSADTISNDVTGLDSSRKKADDAKITKLVTDATTWSSFAQYSDNREKIKRIYGLDDKSPFMSTYMAPVKESVTPNGTKINKIDAYKLSSKFSSLTSTVTSIKGNDYSYFAVVASSIAPDHGKDTATVTTYSAMIYTIDADGKIKNITVTPAASSPMDLS